MKILIESLKRVLMNIIPILKLFRIIILYIRVDRVVNSHRIEIERYGQQMINLLVLLGDLRRCIIGGQQGYKQN